MPMCLNHTDRIAYTKCHSCGKPLCEECKRTTKHGDFCSEQCAGQAARFAEKYPAGVPPKKGGFLRGIVRGIMGMVGVGLAVAILVIVIVAAWGGSESAPEVVRSAYEWGAEIIGKGKDE